MEADLNAALSFVVMKKVKKTVGKQSKKVEGPQAVRVHSRPELVQKIEGMLLAVSRVVDVTPNQILDLMVEKVNECEWQECFERRSIALELHPSDWAALEELAVAHNGGDALKGEISDLSIPIMEAVQNRFTAKELAAMLNGKNIYGLHQVQAAIEREGEFMRERQAKAGKAVAK